MMFFRRIAPDAFALGRAERFEFNGVIEPPPVGEVERGGRSVGNLDARSFHRVEDVVEFGLVAVVPAKSEEEGFGAVEQFIRLVNHDQGGIFVPLKFADLNGGETGAAFLIDEIRSAVGFCGQHGGGTGLSGFGRTVKKDVQTSIPISIREQ